MPAGAQRCETPPSSIFLISRDRGKWRADCLIDSMAQSIDQLKQKYASPIALAQNSGNLQNVNMQGEKLFIRAQVANENLKNDVWNAIKAIDPQYSDLTADITVNSSLPQPAGTSSPGQRAQGRTYEVQPGDTLSAIAEKFYGKASQYDRIFQANRDKMTDPDHVKAGVELVIPG